MMPQNQRRFFDFVLIVAVISAFLLLPSVFSRGRANYLGIQITKSLLSIRPQSSDFWQIYASDEVLVSKNVLDEMINLIHQDPTSNDLRNVLNALNAAKLFGMAEQLADEHMGICQEDVFCQFQAGKAAFLNGDLSKAGSWWQNPTLAPVLDRAVMRSVNDSTKKWSIERYYKVLIVSMPNEPLFQYSLGNLYKFYGQWNLALPYFAKAFDLTPDDPFRACAYAEALVYSGEDVALGNYVCSDAVQKHPNAMWLYQVASQLSERAGDIAYARELLADAVTRFPEHEEPQTWLRSFDKRNSH